jgi:hypothetical protein
MMSRRIKMLAWIVGLPALLVIAILGYAQCANGLASREATEFCARARTGDAIAPVVAAGAGLKMRPILDRERSQYIFVFPGFGMDKAVCTITISDDKVQSATARMFYD